MEVQCLSVPNPYSYLICAGIKEVENRGFGTDYRGRIYIHSSGRYAVRGMPPLDDCPVPVIHEFNEFLGSIQEMEKTSRYIGFADAGVNVFLKNEDRQSDRAVNEYALLSDVYRLYHENPRKPYFLVNAIIGRVDVVDVRQDSNSVWAESGYHHWILSNPVLFAEPIIKVRTTRTGLWTYEMAETGPG